jgi:hypothetical protein
MLSAALLLTAGATAVVAQGGLTYEGFTPLVVKVSAVTTGRHRLPDIFLACHIKADLPLLRLCSGIISASTTKIW